MEDKYYFQNCQKIVLFKNNDTEVLLARRRGENDYDGVYSFVGGKMETSDVSLIEGMRREKCEEIGSEVKIKIYPDFNTMEYFIKKSGDYMVLPHYYAEYVSGEIILLKEEYSDFKWILVKDLDSFEPKIGTILGVVKRLLKLSEIKGEGVLL